MLRHSILCRDKVGQGQEFICRDRVFLCRDRVFMCRDRVWPWVGFFCPDRIFDVMTKYGQIRGFVLRQRILGYDRVWPDQ